MTPPASDRRTLIDRRFPNDPHAAALARHALEGLADDLRTDDLETIRLLTSELVTNAIRHGPHPGADIGVRVDRQDDRLRVEVTDAGAGFLPPDRAGREVGGWGLMLVDQLSARWGVTDGAPTRVWFEIPADRDPSTGDLDGLTIDALLLETQHAAVIATDPRGVVVRWNRHAEQLYGYTKAEALGRPVTDLTVRPGDQHAAEVIVARINAGEPWDGEWRAPRRDGSEIWVRVANAPVLDERGAFIGMIGVSVDISERKAAELALSDSEERLRLALESGRMGTWEWDVGAERVHWSEGLERIHGLEPGAFGGTFEGFQRDMHPEDRARVLGTIERVLREDEEYLLDYRIVRPADGEVRWLSVRGRVLRDDGGRPTGMVGVCTDITERKEAERALAVQYAVSRVLATSRTLEEAVPALLGSIAEALGWEVGLVWRTHEEDEVLRVVGHWHADGETGRRFIDLSNDLALAREEGLPGRVWAGGRPTWVPDFAANHFPRSSTALEEGLHAAFGFPITLGEQILGVVEFFSRRIREPDEPLLELMAAIGAQIGQFVERTLTEVELAESEARKTAVFESALEAIVTMDEAGRIVELNPAAAEMFGHERADVVGRELAEVFVPPSLRERHREAIQRYRRTGRGRILGRRLEMLGLRADGSEFPIELTVTRVDLPDADEILFTGTVRDITPRRRAEELQAKLFESERSAREQVEHAHERMTFLADASRILGGSLDSSKTMAKLATLVVPRLADWCAVDVVQRDGRIEALVVNHMDPEKVELAREFRRRWPSHVDDGGGVAAVLASGEPQLVPVITPEMIEQGVVDPEQRAVIEQLGLRSVMIVPLTARDRVIGAITFASAESGRGFDDADLELASDLARRAAFAFENATLYEERSHIARTLQRSLLPRELPVVDGVEVQALYQPSNISHAGVGGDFYDVFEVGQDAWGVMVGDVCGKGVEAAALTGIARHTLRASGTAGGSPMDALENLNRVMLREDGERFCTVAFARLARNGSGFNLRVVCGGHPAPMVVRTDGTVEPVGAPGSLLGVFEEVAFEERSTSLVPGDLAVFYTDGLIDPRAAEPLDEGGLARLVGACAGRTAAETVDEIRRAVSDPAAQTSDDTCVLGLRVTA